MHDVIAIDGDGQALTIIQKDAADAYTVLLWIPSQELAGCVCKMCLLQTPIRRGPDAERRTTA